MRRPEVSLGLGLAVATVTYAIYQRGMPPGADLRVAPPGDDHLETVRKQNAWVAAGTVAGISLLAKDPTIFIVGGATVVAMDWIARTNIWANPITGSLRNPFVVEAPEANVSPEEVGGYSGGLQAVM